MELSQRFCEETARHQIKKINCKEMCIVGNEEEN